MLGRAADGRCGEVTSCCPLTSGPLPSRVVFPQTRRADDYVELQTQWPHAWPQAPPGAPCPQLLGDGWGEVTGGTLALPAGAPRGRPASTCVRACATPYANFPSQLPRRP